MPHVYANALKLQNKPKIGRGDCVELVQQFTQVGWTGKWRPWVSVLDAGFIRTGTVIATFDKNGRYPNKASGNHAAFFVGMGPLDSHTGRPAYILVMDQWKLKRNIHERKIYSRGRSKAEGNIYDDSDNADMFYVVE
ncbi:BPSL0067 family protein [Duganella sp. P38]|uniref:BPSL0067 family protein n=1 Tax=Duganella sp. P38 TaxID=3423949 RepID=UPI003D79B614